MRAYSFLHIELLTSNCFIRIILVPPKALANAEVWCKRKKEKMTISNIRAKVIAPHIGEHSTSDIS